jgi:hypothetical protein
MVCPFCSQDIHELWQPFCVLTDWQGGALPGPERRAQTVSRSATNNVAAAHISVQLYWAICSKCHELIVKVHRKVAYARKSASREYVDKLPFEESGWFALPQRKTPPTVSSLVPPGMARDYREACWILEDSPRMSSVLSRRILADLLEQYGKIKAYTLAKQIDKFLEDKTHPARHRDNLHYLREIGDFSAHTKTDTKGNIIEVTPEEAEWTLRVVSGLFDYFIVDPATDKAIRLRIDEKLKEAGRKPINKVSEVNYESGKENAENEAPGGDSNAQAQ